MSDKSFSWTPIVVGAIIGALGLLGGFYVADHARHQQAAAQPAVNSFFPDDPAQPSPQEAPAPIVDDPSAELPPLDPVVADEAPQTKEVHPDTVSPAAQPVAVADAPSQQQPTEEATEEPVPQVDDFVEVPMEALDSLQ